MAMLIMIYFPCGSSNLVLEYYVIVHCFWKIAGLYCNRYMCKNFVFYFIFLSKVPRNPRATIMQRMSDMLTRWLDGNLRQNQETDPAGSQDQPDQATARTEEEPVDTSTEAQSSSLAGAVTQSSESVESSMEPVQNYSSNGVESMGERLQGNSAMGTQSESEMQEVNYFHDLPLVPSVEGQITKKQEDMVCENSKGSRDTEKTLNGMCVLH